MQTSEIMDKIKSIGSQSEAEGFRWHLKQQAMLTPEINAAIKARIEEVKGKGVDAFNITADELLQFIERIEQFEAEKKDVAEQIKEIYSEVKGRGFDGKAIRRIIKLRKQNADDRQEEEAILEVYMNALGMG